MLNNVNKICYFIEVMFIEKKVFVYFVNVKNQEIIYIWKYVYCNRFRLQVYVFYCKYEKYLFCVSIYDLFKNQR